jgi:hypothetical protein
LLSAANSRFSGEILKRFESHGLAPVFGGGGILLPPLSCDTFLRYFLAMLFVPVVPGVRLFGAGKLAAI